MKSNPILEPISAYLPRFGAFIFLEFLAFFFLKQHKGMMDEFRYYEGIQRAREEKVFYLNLLKGDENKATLLEMLKGIDRSDVLTAGNSSIILESKKLEKDDFELLNKIVDKIKP